jgi:hypothetical protein
VTGKASADEDAVELVSVTVRDGTQIGYEGVVYPAGSTLSVPAEVAARWQAYGFLAATAEVRTT